MFSLRKTASHVGRADTRKRSAFLTVAAAIGAVAMIAAAPELRAAEAAYEIPPPARDMAAPTGDGLQTAVLAGGCFWGVQAVYQHIKGVKMVLSGYSGGEADTAQYRIVGSGTTGHAEAVEIKFDPKVVSYGQILQVFFSVAHDPTQLNRQGPDWGTQYRSAIFYTDDEQKAVAEAYVAQLDAAKVYPGPVVTQITPLKAFYPAEDYHQDYLINHPDQPYIVYNDLPKIWNLQRMFPQLWQDMPVTVAAAQ